MNRNPNKKSFPVRTGQNQVSGPCRDDIWYVEELADILGMKKWGILKRIQRGKLKAIKDGKRYYFLKEDIINRFRMLAGEQSEQAQQIQNTNSPRRPVGKPASGASTNQKTES